MDVATLVKQPPQTHQIRRLQRMDLKVPKASVAVQFFIVLQVLQSKAIDLFRRVEGGTSSLDLVTDTIKEPSIFFGCHRSPPQSIKASASVNPISAPMAAA